MTRNITEAGRERMRQAGKARAAQMTREERQRYGAMGFAATAARHGRDFAIEKAIAWRLENPSLPERRMIEILNEVGIGAERYEREMRVAGFNVDFAFPELKLIIDVRGGVHRGEFFDRDGAQSRLDAAKEAAYAAEGWTVVVINDTDLSSAVKRAAVAGRIDTLLGAESDEEHPF